jgi:hypothetical protein
LTFSARPLAELPKRVGRPRAFDEAQAKAAFAIVNTAGQSLVNGEQYDDRAGAMKAAAAAKRLVSHVAPDSMKIRTRVYETADGSGIFEWAVYADTTPAKAKK